MATQERGRRLIDEIFETHARLRAALRDQGPRSEEFLELVDRLRDLRMAMDEQDTLRTSRR